MHDQRSAWDMQSDGSYIQRTPDGDECGSQKSLIELAGARQKQATRLKKRKPKGLSGRKNLPLGKAYRELSRGVGDIP